MRMKYFQTARDYVTVVGEEKPKSNRGRALLRMHSHYVETTKLLSLFVLEPLTQATRKRLLPYDVFQILAII